MLRFCVVVSVCALEKKIKKIKKRSSKIKSRAGQISFAFIPGLVDSCVQGVLSVKYVYVFLCLGCYMSVCLGSLPGASDSMYICILGPMFKCTMFCLLL